MSLVTTQYQVECIERGRKDSQQVLGVSESSSKTLFSKLVTFSGYKLFSSIPRGNAIISLCSPTKLTAHKSPVMGKKETTKTRHRNVRIVDEEAVRISAGNPQDRRLNTPQISPGRLTGFVDAGKSRLERFVTRFLRKGRPKVGLINSLKAVALSSCESLTAGV